MELTDELVTSVELLEKAGHLSHKLTTKLALLLRMNSSQDDSSRHVKAYLEHRANDPRLLFERDPSRMPTAAELRMLKDYNEKIKAEDVKEMLDLKLRLLVLFIKETRLPMALYKRLS